MNCPKEPMKETTILEVQNLSKSYRSGDGTLPVLKSLCFTVARGSTCALVGPSGSGKTTLLGLCAGLDRPSSGSVILNGTDLGRMSEDELSEFRNRHTGFIFQTFQLIPTLTALENVMVPAELRGEPDARSHAVELLECVGLGGRAHHYPVQLSGGEQQRVALARALVGNPRLLLLDEPMAHLDAQLKTGLLEELKSLQQRLNLTTVYITHDRAEAEALTPHIVMMEAGRIAT